MLEMFVILPFCQWSPLEDNAWDFPWLRGLDSTTKTTRQVDTLSKKDLIDRELAGKKKKGREEKKGKIRLKLFDIKLKGGHDHTGYSCCIRQQK